jgi:DNA-binding response OmpR family regulator
MGMFDKFLKRDNSAMPSSAATVQAKKKVLIAEADESLKASYIQVLQQEYEVLAVSNGAKGLNSLLNFYPNVFLIDLDLPVMDGKVMLHALRAIPAFKATPVVVISRTADSDTLTQVRMYDNANALILKENATPQEIYKNIKMLTLE